ncbi:Lrp/AsnC family transcriptional regulator [Pseudohoeflea coraliihabitans]|uniref:Lrp/AsnC family transcriptional regulator n=1 Tax=Pseudohoeflea coraliihabitans TaxID=2860393 RepID=A0ABS6WJQ8_9HYPH|nr:Lrp/AsnC family transcriptional regulator [Pseudohoeflea sp. DP4N28-3]MBW3096187.1 Lrp/AsnC family transcriptional regulator [Pseudohoeflea sp. DP4N28-3]
MLDPRDRKILECLQRDAAISIGDLADQVALSVSACWRRIRNLEETGLITGRVALVDRKKANVGMTVFVAVRTSRHSIGWTEEFRATIAAIPEIVEAYRLTGEMDYILRLVVPSVEVYDEVYRELITRLDFMDVSAFIGMEELKYTTAVPLKYL